MRSLGCCIVKGKSIKIDWWNTKAGCLKEGTLAKETWVRAIRLLAHLRGMEFFKRVVDVCGGFMLVDVEIEEKRHLQ